MQLSTAKNNQALKINIPGVNICFLFGCLFMILLAFCFYYSDLVCNLLNYHMFYA